MAVSVVNMERTSEEFLRTIFGDIPEGTSLCIWCLDKKSRWFNAIPPQGKINALVKQGQNVYFGLALGPDGLPSKRRISATEAKCIGCLWADVDFGTEGHKKKVPPTFDDALALVKEMPLEPSIVVHSGNGLHVYWVFKEPWVFADEDERIQAEDLSERWSYLLRSKATAKEWTLDSTFDLARVLRVPGTMNLKDPKNPKPVSIISESEARYNPDDFMQFLPEIPTTEKKIGIREARIDGLVLRSDAAYPVDKFEALSENNEKFAATWTHKRRGLKDTSASGWDLSLALFAAHAGWSPQDICNLLICHRRKYEYDLKLHRPDYYSSTVARAIEASKHDRAISQLSETLASEHAERPDETPEQRRERSLNIVSDTFGVKVTGIKKFNSDPPEYSLSTERGVITLKGVDKLVSQTQFRYVMAAACGVAIRNYKSEEWRLLVQTLLNCCEEVDVGDMGSEAGEMKMLVFDYLQDTKITDKEIAVKRRTPFENKGRINIYALHLQTWMRTKLFTNKGLKEIGRQLTQMGAEANRVPATINGIKTTIYVWSLPEDFNGFIPKREE
jgi:hypothetical protein